MFANFTEETCTGTGDTLALAGAVTGAIPFSASFADGDLVAYVVEDSGGSIKVAGVGTYVSATDDIIRNDTWNYNGTVVDKNPSTNITLSGGTHTIRCDAVARGLSITPNQPAKWYMNANGYDSADNWDGSTSTSQVSVANTCIYGGIRLNRARVISSLTVNVISGDAGATLSKAGFYSVGLDSKPDKLLASVSIDVTTTGITSASLVSPILLPAGDYYTAFVTDGTPTMRTFLGGALSATSYANTLLIPRNYAPGETLSGWTDLPASPSPDSFTENYPVIVAWK
jgi:hypothetical protein